MKHESIEDVISELFVTINGEELKLHSESFDFCDLVGEAYHGYECGGIQGCKTVTVTNAFGVELEFDIVIYDYITAMSKAIELQEITNECEGCEFDTIYAVAEFSLENFIDGVFDGRDFMEEHDSKVVNQLMEEIAKTLN